MKNNRKIMQGLQTTCPLMKQENVIKNVQKQALIYQNQRKSYLF